MTIFIESKLSKVPSLKFSILLQAGIKIARRNINNLRYAEDTILMAESEEELKPLDESERVQFSRSVVSDSLRPHESQHTRPPCPSPTPGVHSDSHTSSQ